MAYNMQLANRVREYLADHQHLDVEEKKMFRGLTFMVNGKMCVSVSGENLMCRFNPGLQEEIAEKPGFQPMIMKSKAYRGYCYVSPEGIATKRNFSYWMDLCIDFNEQAKSSKKKKKQ